MARITYPLAALVGLGAGIRAALPAPDITGRCPAPGEGRTLCIIQKVWIHELLVIALAVGIALILAHVLVFKLPDLLRRWRAGELRAQPMAPSPDDQALVAASWGYSHDSGRTKSKPAWRKRVSRNVEVSPQRQPGHPRW